MFGGLICVFGLSFWYLYSFSKMFGGGMFFGFGWDLLVIFRWEKFWNDRLKVGTSNDIIPKSGRLSEFTSRGSKSLSHPPFQHVYSFKALQKPSGFKVDPMTWDRPATLLPRLPGETSLTCPEDVPSQSRAWRKIPLVCSLSSMPSEGDASAPGVLGGWMLECFSKMERNPMIAFGLTYRTTHKKLRKTS